MGTVNYCLKDIAKRIDHALLQPLLDDQTFVAGCELATSWAVAALCVKSADVTRAMPHLRNSGVVACAVVGFPHANVPTEIMCMEAERAFDAGATEIDAVLALSRVVSQDWEAVRSQIERLQAVTERHRGLLKLILETGLFPDRESIGRVCQICCEVGVAFVKTSTGFATARAADGSMKVLGATVDDVRFLSEQVNSRCGVKASGGIRTLSDAVAMLDAGATRLGTGATAAILEAASQATSRYS